MQIPEEEISTHTTANEPSVGEKRPRDEEAKQEQSPSQANRPNPATQQVQSIATNGSYSSNGGGTGMLPVQGMGIAQGQGVVPGQDLSAMGYDALYIGDLQWVRLFLVSPCVYKSKFEPFLSLSGQPTRTYDR